MQITTEGLTNHIYDTLADTDAEIEFNDEIGSHYLEIRRDSNQVRIFYNTQPGDVFDTADIEMADLVNTRTGRGVDYNVDLFHVVDVYDFVSVIDVLLETKL